VTEPPTTIPATALAVHLHASGDVRLADEPVPEPAPEEVLLRITDVGSAGPTSTGTSRAGSGMTSRVVLIGCGGIGSQLLPPLVRYLSNRPEPRPLLVLVDGDAFEARNLARQGWPSRWCRSM
jgi:hypothetical protein